MTTERIQLIPHRYRYFPYEKVLAAREIHTLFGVKCAVGDGPISVDIPVSAIGRMENLVYFSGFERGEPRIRHETIQAKLERLAVNGDGGKKLAQQTRYGVHGLHEYKGKFNPQIVRGILNVMGCTSDSRVLDPFCGSGTSLVECALGGITADGIDFNPLAVSIANAKCGAIEIPAGDLRSLLELCRQTKPRKTPFMRSEESWLYLERWIPADNLYYLEGLRRTLSEYKNPKAASVASIIASNLIRTYSNQEPTDLRIRQRFSPLPDTSISDAFVLNFMSFIEKHEGLISVGVRQRKGNAAKLGDSTQINNHFKDASFDFAITSPPYATALPYIDMQRISIVWLGLLEPQGLMLRESELIGTREANGTAKKSALLSSMQGNSNKINSRLHEMCMEMNSSISASDGFRRRATPLLLYKYYSQMQSVFKSVYGALKNNGKFALVVGTNKATIADKTYHLETPAHLAQIAEDCGYDITEIIPFQAYQRYGLHSKNSVQGESLVIVQKSNKPR